MGGRGSSSGGGARGIASQDGKMKTATVYHGSWAEFSQFDNDAVSDKKGRNHMYGEGWYFTDNPETARLYGDYVYKVEIKYSTDNRTAKKTGRTKDFQYDPKTGYWVIPFGSQKNIKITSKKKVT